MYYEGTYMYKFVHVCTTYIHLYGSDRAVWALYILRVMCLFLQFYILVEC